MTIAKKFFSKPQLATVRRPVQEKAGAMARLLQERIEGTRTEPTSLILEPELVLRHSA
ncbi:substrate-binding domain-containing protein [Streptomyces sp. NPDC059349]|uniref:substrate-binding domain-containing protein n=1 Tax=Streptomyces sp. NPDC059349 TaxID=3346808 RepID=UPI0036830671